MRPLAMRETTLKGLTTAGFTSLAVGVAAMVVLHATSGLNPVRVVISLHLYTPLGWLLPVALVLFGLGACAFAAVARQVAAPRWLSPMLLVWAGFLSLVAIFPTDPPGLPEVSLISAIHRYAAFCAFSTMAVMGLAFAKWARGTDCPDKVRRAVLACSLVAAVALTACSAPYVAEWFGVPREPGAFAAGLLQRTTVGMELVALAFVGAWLSQSVRRDVEFADWAARLTSAPPRPEAKGIADTPHTESRKRRLSGTLVVLRYSRVMKARNRLRSAGTVSLGVQRALENDGIAIYSGSSQPAQRERFAPQCRRYAASSGGRERQAAASGGS